MQFDRGYRGFSFNKDGPLDMRMDSTQKLSAKDVVNKFSEKMLANILKDLGEVSMYKKIARAIVNTRKKKLFDSTKSLGDLILQTVGRYGKIHPATKVFQAIRIYVNKELESISLGLKKAIQSLSANSCIAVMSFHSLEDRIVKNIFRNASLPLKDIYGQSIGKALLTLLTKKPIVPTKKEVLFNKRARSAKLRFVCKKHL